MPPSLSTIKQPMDGTVHEMPGFPPIPVEERYWPKVNVLGEDDCWEWTAHRNQKGYGTIRYAQRMYLAHRVGWMIEHGELPPDDKLVRHTCDNPPCQNPKHWLLGTNADNMADRQKRGRQGRGIQMAGKIKLTKRQVNSIRREYRRNPYRGALKDIAQKYDVSPSTVGSIVNRKTWTRRTVFTEKS